MNITLFAPLFTDKRTPSPWPQHRRHGGMVAAPASIALACFMGVVSMLFILFIAAYLMRMTGNDWSVIRMPWQLGLSTGLLVVCSVFFQVAAGAAAATDPRRLRIALLLAGGMGIGFLSVQCWAWQALLSMQVRPAGNPAAGFFYLLTAMHGLHVAGGVMAWCVVMRHVWRSAGDAADRLRVVLCARYWHFLLAVWLVLLAVLLLLTPTMARLICGV